MWCLRLAKKQTKKSFSKGLEVLQSSKTCLMRSDDQKAPSDSLNGQTHTQKICPNGRFVEYPRKHSNMS